jgi:hypothetical protein
MEHVKFGINFDNNKIIIKINAEFKINAEIKTTSTFGVNVAFI